MFSPDGKQLLAGGRSTAFWYAEPIGWNDPDRAAEKLQLLLLSNADFASRIRMLSENLRLHEALAKLDAKEVRVQAALAAAQANWHASRREWPEAVAGFDRLMAADPTAPEAWLRTPGLLRLATALVHQDRPADAAMLLQGGAKRRTEDGLPAVDQVEVGFTYAAADGTVRVTELLPRCSGSRADLVPGDTLLKVNDTELTSETVPRLGELLAGEAGTKVRLTVRHAGSEKPHVIELTREPLLSDPATGELLHSLRSAVHSRLARNPRDAGLLELRAELAGQCSDWNAQVADFTAVIQILSAQPTEEFSARLRRLYRARGDAYMRLQRWRSAADDYAHLITPETKDVELLSSRARAHEALKNWDAAAADWSRVATGNPEGAGLLAEFARRLAAGGQIPRAKRQFEESQTLYQQSLEVDPENELAAAELAQVLLDKERNENATQWAVLRPVEAKSMLGTTLSILPDDSVLASGANPLKERYCVELTVGTAIDLAAVRLEALTHPSLPGSGPGRNPSGAFSQTSWSVTATSPNRVEPIKVEFDTAWADHQSEWGAIKVDGQWDIWGGQGGNCTAIWSMAKSISLAPGTKLAFEMQYTGSEIRGNLGRFRLSVSGDQAVFARERTRLAARMLADPWSRLAAAYQVIGDHQALDKLLDRHPAAAAGVGDLYGAAQDWERAIAEYHKTLTDQPSNRDLFNKLAAAYQLAGRTREAVRCLAKIHIANPQDSVLLLKLASLQAWFQQDSEWADSCRRALTSAGEVKLPQVAEKMAKACCLLPSVDNAQVEAALALARQAVELGKTSPWLAWFQMTLGMAEYRSGRFAEADARLLAAANGGITSPSVVFTAAFYRASSLYRQGEENEARQLATEAAAKMKPLPKDEANPLAGGNDTDELILWLAYKEAKAMIKFDAAPATPAAPAGK